MSGPTPSSKQILDALFDAVHDLKRKFDKAKQPKGGKAIGFAFAEPKVRRLAAE